MAKLQGQKTDWLLPGSGLGGSSWLQSDLREFLVKGWDGGDKTVLVITKLNAFVKTQNCTLKKDGIYCFSKSHLRGKEDPFTYSCRIEIMHHKIQKLI